VSQRKGNFGQTLVPVSHSNEAVLPAAWGASPLACSTEEIRTALPHFPPATATAHPRAEMLQDVEEVSSGTGP
jgi:hypothetical protein